MTMQPTLMAKLVPISLNYFLTGEIEEKLEKKIVKKLHFVNSTSNAKKANRLLPIVNKVQQNATKIMNLHTMLNSFIILNEKKQCSRMVSYINIF